MDYTRAFTFARDDSQWVSKLIVGVVMTLLSFLILPALILQGYQLDILRLVSRGDDRRLPEWEDMGRLLGQGFKLAVAQLVYVIPAMLAFVVFLIPAIPLMDSGGDVAEVFGSVVVCGGFAVYMVLILLVALLQPAIIIQFARNDGELASAFRFAEVWQITRSHIGEILMTIVVTIAASLALAIIIPLSIITCIGPFVLMLAGPLWLGAAQYHMYGQIAARIDPDKSDKEVHYDNL